MYAAEAFFIHGPVFEGVYMEAESLIERLKDFKEKRGLTLHDLSMKLDVSVSTLERWFRTKRINRVYAKMVKEAFRI